MFGIQAPTVLPLISYVSGQAQIICVPSSEFEKLLLIKLKYSRGSKSECIWNSGGQVVRTANGSFFDRRSLSEQPFENRTLKNVPFSNGPWLSERLIDYQTTVRKQNVRKRTFKTFSNRRMSDVPISGPNCSLVFKWSKPVC